MFTILRLLVASLLMAQPESGTPGCCRFSLKPDGKVERPRKGIPSDPNSERTDRQTEASSNLESRKLGEWGRHVPSITARDVTTARAPLE